MPHFSINNTRQLFKRTTMWHPPTPSTSCYGIRRTSLNAHESNNKPSENKNQDCTIHNCIAKSVQVSLDNTEVIFYARPTTCKHKAFAFFSRWFAYYLNSRLEDVIASLMDCTRCWIRTPSLFCRCVRNSFSSFSRFSLMEKKQKQKTDYTEEAFMAFVWASKWQITEIIHSMRIVN